MIDYDPAAAVKVWPEAEYPAVLCGCIEKQSKAGNWMYELTFNVFRDASHQQLSDYIVIPGFEWRLKRLAQALGEMAEFEAKTFDPRRHIDKNLTVRLKVEPAKGEFEEKNKIAAYLPYNGAAIPKLTANGPSAAFEGDDPSDLPF